MRQEDLAAVKAAIIDGRAHNVYYKQTQLKKLHKALVKHADGIIAAITHSDGISRSEARHEFSLALETLRRVYVELDASQELDAEYRIAKSRNAAENCVPFGVAVIQVYSYSTFFSIIAPLSSAIAAGNCVIIEACQLSKQILKHTSILDVTRKAAEDALDSDSFAFVSKPIDDKSILSSAVCVRHESTEPKLGAARTLLTPENAPTLAIIDRSADLEEAAKALVDARFAFGGRSPYAPDVVLVNEFVESEFLKSLVRYLLDADGVVREDRLDQDSSAISNRRPYSIDDVRKTYDTGVHVVSEASIGMILNATKRTDELIKKRSHPVLLVHSIKSLDDAIDLVTGYSQDYLAAYHFSSPDTAKYLSQFVPAHVSFVNQVPRTMLVGPPAPVGYPVDPSLRYPVTLFQRPSPVYITKPIDGRGTELANVWHDDPTQLYDQVIKALPEHARRKQFSSSFGFFEHAFLLHFGLIALTSIGTVVGGVWWYRSGLHLGR